MHASNLLKAVLKPRSITTSSSGQSLNTKDSKSRSGPRASAPETTLSLSVSKKATPSPARMSCLCAPTNHAGSFRCRLHRGGQQSWGGKPITPSAPAPKPTAPPPPASESRPSSTPVAPLPVPSENGLSKRLLHQSPRQPSSNFSHAHTHRTCDARPSRLSRVSVATQLEPPVVAEAHVPAPVPKEAPGTVRYLKFTGGAGCASAAVLEAGVVAIRKLQVSGKKDVMLEVFSSGQRDGSLDREYTDGAGLKKSGNLNSSKYEQGPLLRNVNCSW